MKTTEGRCGMLRFPRVVGCAAIVLLAASLAAAAGQDEALQRTLKYAPAGMVGLIHVDPRSAVKELLAEVSMKKDVLPADQAKAASRALESLLALDVYMVAVTDANSKKSSVVPVLGLFGKLSPDDVGAAMALLPEMSPTKWVKAGNGRYTMGEKGPLQLVVGGEAPELPAGVSLLGVGAMLDKDFFAQLGHKPTEALAGLLASVDAAADVWLAVDLNSDTSADAPKTVAGSMFVGRKGLSKITIEFKDPNWAAGFCKDLQQATKSVAIAVMGSLSEVHQQGAVVTIEAKSTDPLAGPIASAIVEAKDKAARLASGRNLKAIGQAIAMYEIDKVKLPPDLASLSPRYLDAAALASPVAAGKFKLDDKPAKPPADYVYIRLPSMPVGAQAAEIILAYEKLDTYDGEGTFVLQADLRVRWVEAKEFDKLLAKTTEYAGAKP